MSTHPLRMGVVGRPPDRWHYEALFLLTFPIFMVGAVLRRVRRPTERTRRLSLIADARARADAALPFAFMG